MRSYEEYCSIAKALDVVGDRWTLLIVRELLLRGPCRYTDLRYGLPGIATNLLAERLRELEGSDIIRREDAPPPVATTLFELTRRGRELAPVLEALGHWGGDLMTQRAAADEFRSHWLTFPVTHFLQDRSPKSPPITIQVRTGDQPMLIETVDGAVRARPGAAENPDAVLTGPPEVILGALTGRLDLAKAKRLGLRFDGDASVLQRIQPESVPAR
jgi:DNA-binding HxlR family transcriptional regulator